MIEISLSENTATAQTIAFKGELDTISAVEAETRFYDLVTELTKPIILDFSQLSYISSSGLRLLLGIKKSVDKVGGQVKISGVNDMVAKVFKLTGFDALFR
jgi:anti-anti-sigma factor